MAAIEHVADRLHADAENIDVDMPAASEDGDPKSSPSSSLSNKLVSSPMDSGNDEFQKFLVTGTSNRPHHSGKKKVVSKALSGKP